MAVVEPGKLLATIAAPVVSPTTMTAAMPIARPRARRSLRWRRLRLVPIAASSALTASATLGFISVLVTAGSLRQRPGWRDSDPVAQRGAAHARGAVEPAPSLASDRGSVP